MPQNEQVEAPLARRAPTLPGTNGDEIVVRARIYALRERALQRTPWSQPELDVLLQGALDAAAIAKDIAGANTLLADAERGFDDSIRTSNRNWYVLSLVLGIVLIAGLTALLLAVAQRIEAFNGLASPSTIVSLCAFAGMGSVTSVLTRLGDLDFRKEISRKFAIYSAMAKPLVAVSFAAVVFIILKYDMVVLAHLPGSSNPEIIWVGSFLCGFSERFAEDTIIGLIPTAKPGPAAKAT